MSNLYFIIAFRFVLILIVQGLIFNKFDLFGLYDPHISIIFVLIFPIKTNRIFFLIISFFFGLILDFFSNSIGINAAAFVTIAFVKPYIMNFVFGNFYDPHGIKILKDYIQDSTIYRKVLFVLIIILIHHFIMFSLESFTIDQIKVVIKKTFYTSLLSLFFCSSLIYLLAQNER